MGYKNTHSLAFEVEQALAGNYNVHSHGDIGAFYDSVMNADMPGYTAMVYHSSQHEMFSEFKYDKIEIQYDAGLKNTRDAVHGPPMEAYIPPSFVVPDGTGKSTSVEVRNPVAVPKKSVIDEIQAAQAEITGNSGRLILRKTEIEQEIHLKRKVRKVELVREKSDLARFNNPQA